MLTAEQNRLGMRLYELDKAGDCLGVVALEREALALARDSAVHPSNAGAIYEWLGNGFWGTGDYGRAREMHEQQMATAEGLGDRAGVARAYGGLGNCYLSTGDYRRACEMREQQKAIFEELGDRWGVATASGNLGTC